MGMGHEAQACDTSECGRVARRTAQRAGAHARRCDTAGWAATTRPLLAPGRAGWAVCAHCALDQFLT